MTGSTIRCVYCNEVRPTPRKGEHIFLRGLGGRATTRRVCGPCNQRLGDGLDREFLRTGTIAMGRLFDPAITQGTAADGQFIPTEFGYTDIQLFTSGVADLLPQVGLTGTTSIVMASEPDQPITDRFLLDFDPATVRIRRDIRDRKEHVPARIIIDRRGKSHLLRARSDGEADALLAMLSKGLPTAPYSNWAPNENRIDFRTSLDVNVPGRGAAKMSFNLAAEVLGTEEILRDAFDGVRAYILGDDVEEGPATASNGEQGLLVDQRYVDPWMENGPGATLSVGHAILLEEQSGLLVGHVLLFQGIERFRVRLGRRHGRSGERRMLMALWCRPDGDWWMPERGFPWRHDEPPIATEA